MTLDTRIIIKNPDVPPQYVLDWINRELLRAVDPVPAEWPPSHLDADLVAEWWPGVAEVGNQLGEGLFAIASVRYRVPPGPITSTSGTGYNCDGSLNEEDAEDRRDYDPDWQPVDRELVTGSMEVSFDTAYGFRDGGDISQLEALRRLGDPAKGQRAVETREPVSA